MSFTVFWAPKGGVGCSTAAALFARRQAQQKPVLLVDASPQQDLSGAVGVRFEPVDELSDAPSPAGTSGEVVGVGMAGPPSTLLDRLGFAHGEAPLGYGHVVVDLGWVGPTQVDALPHSDRFTMVVANRYLSLRAAANHNIPAEHQALLVVDNESSLTVEDCEAVLGDRDRVAVMAWTPTLARMVDAGLLLARDPGGQFV